MFKKEYYAKLEVYFIYTRFGHTLCSLVKCHGKESGVVGKIDFVLPYLKRIVIQFQKKNIYTKI